MLNEHVEAINVLASPRLFSWRAVIMERLAKAAVPAIYQFPEMAEEGGLMGYGQRLSLSYRQLAILVDKILRGAKPADLPVEQPKDFALAINLKTARALGLTVPPSLLVQADEVIEWAMPRGSQQMQCRLLVPHSTLVESANGTFRTWRDVRLESGMRTKADVRRPL